MDLSLKCPYRNFVLLGIFAVAMGFLEAIVVVYLRQIYYPQGFDFPLTPFSLQMLFAEWLREICTIIMLICIAIIAGKDYLQKFSYFLYTFAVWDIFYYIGLKLFLNWPSSFLTWDILFLIPLPWVGPVLAPVICSLTMILLAGTIIGLQEKGCMASIELSEWGLIFFGAFIIFCTFVWDCFKIIMQEGAYFQQTISQYRPTHYNWHLFAFGEILILCALTLMLLKYRSNANCLPRLISKVMR